MTVLRLLQNRGAATTMYINLVEGRKKVQEIVFRLLNHEMMEFTKLVPEKVVPRHTNSNTRRF
jgi:hypothetical protein